MAPAMPRARVGPATQRILEAGARARPRLGAAVHLLGVGPRDLPLLRRLRWREAALLAEAATLVPRVTGRWMRELAEAEGVPAALEGLRDATPDGALERLARRAGWEPSEPHPRAAALGVLDHLVEIQLLAEHRGRYTWRGPAVVRDLALAPEEEVRARELFGGALAWDRACLDALPDVLRGKAPPLRPGRDPAGLWDAFHGSPEHLLLRRLGLLALPAPPEDVLDLACGTGHTTACAIEATPGASLVAIDTTEASYPLVEDRARQSAGAVGRPAQVTLAKAWPGWGEALPFPDGSFDAVVFALREGFVPAHRRADVAREARRVLRPGGHLVTVGAVRPSAAFRPRAWELRALARLRHAAGFAVQGFHGLPTAEEHAAALAEAGFPAAPAPWRLEGLLGVVQAPPRPA